MEEDMSKLFTFLENFDPENKIRILDEEGTILFDGVMGDVPQRTSNMMSVVRGTAIWHGDRLTVIVRKC